MQTSRIRKLVSSLLVFALLLGFFAALDFFLELRGTKSAIVWSNFQESEDLDMVYIGTSIAGKSFNPVLIDEEYGSSSANMASPLQKLEESYLGIQSAYERFGIKRVVMTLDFTCLQLNETPNLGSTYLTQRGRVVGLEDYLKSTAWLIADKNAASVPGSINMLFPWVSNHPSWKDPQISIARNVRTKIDGSTLAEAVEINEPGWFYIGKGYGNSNAVLDYNSKDLTLFGSLEKIENLGFDEQAIQGVKDICSYCKDKGIELIVVNVPVPTYNIHAYGQFFIDSQQAVKELLADLGVEYYDFVYARPEFLQLSFDDFSDNQHLNAVGADKFSTAFVTFMRMLDRGEDTSSLFYSPKEYLDSICFLSGLSVTARSDGGDIQIIGNPYAGNGVEIEYQMLVKPADSDTWMLVQDYGPSNVATYKPDANGTYSVRVNARTKGSDVEFDHFNTYQVVY